MTYKVDELFNWNPILPFKSLNTFLCRKKAEMEKVNSCQVTLITYTTHWITLGLRVFCGTSLHNVACMVFLVYR